MESWEYDSCAFERATRVERGSEINERLTAASAVFGNAMARLTLAFQRATKAFEELDRVLPPPG